ncbi:MAG: hypothetical protein V7709_09300 [Halioglobus sp.]
MKIFAVCLLLSMSSFAVADVLVVNIFKSMPGKNQLTLQYGQEAKAILSKLGANITLGVDMDGRLHLARSFNNWAAWAKFGKALQANGEWTAFLKKINKSPSAVLEDNYMMNTPVPGEVGAVYQVFIFEPVMGRAGDLLRSAMQAKAMHEKAGASVSISIDQLQKLHYVTSYDSWDDWAKVQDTPNPEFQAFMKKQGEDPKAKLVKVYTATSM